ncbi:hypothetical protein HYH02_006276 [Chlamydomonas schloesseri]|uniref:Uncharacterized protein n=1 Tax=Chlamydomonas schloesseri TaxID=2026947 RepID=A0A836B6K5_9CHLO|nr:hypothetical protein HYH02_006276 [Chlamydomonas schloesseri]|eukprot:KAG2448928.1 hypothetical protein HYH02_006276 [Chlamydomonas schloesseri]
MSGEQEAAEQACEQSHKREARGHEVVKVNGLTIIRKRKAPPAAALAQIPIQQQPDASSSGGESPPAIPADVAAQDPGAPLLGEGFSAADKPLDESGQPQPDDVGAPASRNLSAEVCSLVTFVPPQCPASTAVGWILEQALSRAVGAAPDSAEATASSQVVSSFRAGLEAQVADAQRLLAAGGAEDLQRYDALPGLVKHLCAGSRAAAGLRAKLAALEQEEEAWLQLQVKYPDAALAAALDNKLASAGGEGDVAAAIRILPVCLDDVCIAQRRADMQLGFQVDALGTMLDKAEQLVEQAQQACSLLQAEYHKENFQAYVHVNSPQVLVKILSQAAPPASMLDFVPASQPSSRRMPE